LQLKKWAWWTWFLSICIGVGGIIIASIHFFLKYGLHSDTLPARFAPPFPFLPHFIFLAILGILVYRKKSWFNVENVKISDIEKAVEKCSNSKDAAALLKMTERNFERICYNLRYLLPWEEEIITKAIKSSDNSRDAAKKLKMPKYFFEGLCKEFEIELPWKKENKK
jgi:hypothetical protein